MNLCLGDPFAGAAQLSLNLGLGCRDLAKLLSELVPGLTANYRGFDRGGAGANRLPGESNSGRQLLNRHEELGLCRDAPLEGILASAPQMQLRPPRGARCTLRAATEACNFAQLFRLGSGSLGPCQRLNSRLEARPGMHELSRDRIRAVGFARGLSGESPERLATALDARAELGLLLAECLGADRESLVSRTQRGQASPKLGSLTIAGGKSLLDRQAPLVRLTEPLLKRVAGGPRGTRSSLGLRNQPALNS